MYRLQSAEVDIRLTDAQNCLRRQVESVINPVVAHIIEKQVKLSNVSAVRSTAASSLIGVIITWRARVMRLTVVTARGEIRVLTPADELFTAMLGAGSALAVVVDVTFELAGENVVRGAEQRVISFETRDQAVAFAREALRIQRDHVLPDDSLSMELVVTGTKALVATVVFYDTFQGRMADFVAPLETLAARLGLRVVAASHFGSWFETAAALWPVIDGMKGNPLAMLQHCMGTEGVPSDAVLDAVCDTIIAEAPLDEAPLSIVEIRTLGGRRCRSSRSRAATAATCSSST